MQEHESDVGGSTTDTGGGANISGNVDAGRDFTGRDKANVSISITNKPDEPPRKPRQRRLRKSGMAVTIEDELRRKFAEHELKIDKMAFMIERNERVTLDHVQELRTDMTEMKADLKPLRGLGIVAQPQQAAADKEQTTAQSQLVVRLLTIMAASFSGGVIILFVALLIGLVYLIYGGG